MTSSNVVNLKCGGCANTIRAELFENGIMDVGVDVENKTISFSGDEETVKKF